MQTVWNFLNAAATQPKTEIKLEIKNGHVVSIHTDDKILSPQVAVLIDEGLVQLASSSNPASKNFRIQFVPVSEICRVEIISNLG